MHDLDLASSPASFVIPDASELEVANHYLRFVLCKTVVTRAFGVDVAVTRALRVSLGAWNSMAEDIRAPFYDFIVACFPHRPPEQLREYEMIGVPWNAIPLFLPICSLDAPVYRPLHLEHPWFYIMDVVAPDWSRIIPSTLFIPYKGRSSQRCRQVLDRINPIPLWFFTEDGGLGLPLRHTEGVRLLRGQEELRLLNSQNNPITTLKIKFGWINYKPTEKQIRASANKPLNNLDRLARSTAGAVRNFMSDETKKTMIDPNPHPKWHIGTRPEEIKIDDVLLLGVIFVSDGAAMPLLAVRQ